MIIRKHLYVVDVWRENLSVDYITFAALHRFRSTKEFPCEQILFDEPSCEELGRWVKDNRFNPPVGPGPGGRIASISAPVAPLAAPPCDFTLIAPPENPAEIQNPVFEAMNHFSESQLINVEFGDFTVTVDMNVGTLSEEMAGRPPIIIGSVMNSPGSHVDLYHHGFEYCWVVEEISDESNPILIGISDVMTLPTGPGPNFLCGLPRQDWPIQIAGASGAFLVHYERRALGSTEADCGTTTTPGDCCEDDLWPVIAPALLTQEGDVPTKLITAMTVDNLRTRTGKTGKHMAMITTLGQVLAQAVTKRNSPDQRAEDKDGAVDL